jgi:hypothetical protein
MHKLRIMTMLLAFSLLKSTWAHANVDELVATNQRIEQQLSVIAELLNVRKKIDQGDQDWLTLKSIWQPEFDIIDSLRVGINTSRLFEAIPAGQKKSMATMTAHHNLYIASQLCQHNLSALRLYRNACRDISIKRAIQMQYQYSEQGCQQLQELSEQYLQQSQNKQIK